MRDQERDRHVGRVTIENVNHPGQTSEVDAGLYHAMRLAMLDVEAKGVIARESSRPLRRHRSPA